VVVFVAAFIVAGVFPDDDPTTDDSSGAGALAAVVGGVLMVIYLAVTKPTPKAPSVPFRTCPSCGAKVQCDLRVCPTCGAESQPWIRHHDTWWFRSPSGWQWVDEAGIWRWYRDGTRSSGSTTDMTPNLAIDPALVQPPSVSEAHSPSASSV
jgi:hypothetical protein